MGEQPAVLLTVRRRPTYCTFYGDELVTRLRERERERELIAAAGLVECRFSLSSSPAARLHCSSLFPHGLQVNRDSAVLAHTQTSATISCRYLTRATESCCRQSLTISATNHSGRASELGGIGNLVDRRRSSSSRSERPPFSS